MTDQTSAPSTSRQPEEVSAVAGSRPAVSIVVAVHGNASDLPGLATAISSQDITGGIELIVVDNHLVPVLPPGSTHPTCGRLPSSRGRCGTGCRSPGCWRSTQAPTSTTATGFVTL